MSVKFLCLPLAIIVLSVPHAFASAGTAASAIVGRITVINALPDGSATVIGWACQTGNSTALQVHLYVGDPYPIGQIVTSTTANVSFPTVDCGTRKAPHGFIFRLGSEVIFRYGGMRVFAYAIRPERGDNPPLEATEGAALPTYTTVGPSPRNCYIADIASLKRCFAQTSRFDQFSLLQDLDCGSASECCGVNSTALMHLEAVSHRTIDGNGHVIHRGPGALACKGISIDHASDILVKSLTLDEGADIPPCELTVKDCPSTIDVNDSQRVRIDDTHIYFGKGYVVHVWGTDGFGFVNSSLSDSGIIGLYVGHYKYAPSRNVVIADSVFAHSRTNAIAIQGASGQDSFSPVLILNNVFTRNHWHGLWPVAGMKDGITSGGQVLIADAANVRFSGNIVGDGACGNCNPPGQQVGALEIGDDPQLPAGVSNLEIDDNYIYNDFGIAFGQNPGTHVSDVTIESNRIAGNVVLDTLVGPTVRNRNEFELKPSSPKHQTAPIFGAAPSLGASTSPIFQCKRDGAVVFARTRTCDGSGDVLSVLGFSYESSNPLARTVFSCQPAKNGSDQFLSFDLDCEGGLQVAQLGFAIPK